MFSTLPHSFTPALAMSCILLEKNLSPHLLVHPQCVEDLLGKDGVEAKSPDCVVIGDAMHEFTYDNMNKCFKLLMSSSEVQLYSLGKGKYYQVFNREKCGLSSQMKVPRNLSKYRTASWPWIITLVNLPNGLNANTGSCTYPTGPFIGEIYLVQDRHVTDFWSCKIVKRPVGQK